MLVIMTAEHLNNRKNLKALIKVFKFFKSTYQKVLKNIQIKLNKKLFQNQTLKNKTKDLKYQMLNKINTVVKRKSTTLT